jgi:ribosome-binding protein aMBF1 (putative translation factor)
MPERVSERLRAAIQRFGWTQTELAHRANTHPPIVSQIVRGALKRVGGATATRVLGIAERGP